MSVYFVTCREANAVKIGLSLEPHARLSEIQWGCPLELKLEAVLPGVREDERNFHARFEHLHIRGEWFAIDEMIEAIIAANPPGPRPADAVRERVVKAKVRRKLREEEKRAEEGLSEYRRGVVRLERIAAKGEIHFPFRDSTPSQALGR
jgi:hypothetical protein